MKMTIPDLVFKEECYAIRQAGVSRSWLLNYFASFSVFSGQTILC